MKILDEFKKFAVRGNVIDLAVGVIIGTAFNKIVTSLVEDVIMPPIGYLAGGLKFDNYKWVLQGPVLDKSGKVISEGASINYGNFIQIFLNFLIIAFSMFMVVKLMNTLKEREDRKKKKEEDEPTPVETKEIQLLREIRNALVSKEK